MAPAANVSCCDDCFRLKAMPRHVPGSFPPFLVVFHRYWCYSVPLIEPAHVYARCQSKKRAYKRCCYASGFIFTVTLWPTGFSFRSVCEHKQRWSGFWRLSGSWKVSVYDSKYVWQSTGGFFLLFIYVVIIYIWSLKFVFWEPVENILIIFSRTTTCSFTENMKNSQYFGCFSAREREGLTLKLWLIDFVFLFFFHTVNQSFLVPSSVLKS